jgi:hypothetical protein
MQPKHYIMLQRTLFVIFIAITLLAISCKKETVQEEDPTVTYRNYSRFDTGSYWVYRQFRVDSLGNATPTDIYDSCYVEKDTLINGKSYKKVHRPNFLGFPYNQYTLERDSLHYIVSPYGHTYFSYLDFETIFYENYAMIDLDTLYHLYLKMEDKDTPFNTPAGTFVTCDARTTVEYNMNVMPTYTPRVMHKRYAENIGIVTETIPFYSSDPNYTERRLVRYHVVVGGL